MAINTSCVGQTFGPFTKKYSWKDLILYALGVGADETDLQYVYEKEQKALPMFAVTTISDDKDGEQMRVLGANFAGIVHYEQELIMHKPLEAKDGVFKSMSSIYAIYDQGKDRGALFQTKVDTSDESGNKLFTNIISSMARMDGGFGGEPAPYTKIEFPDREADMVEVINIPTTQALLYRLSGDYNILHADPKFARKVGFEKPILHGLCSFGYAGRLLIKKLCNAEPERFKRMKVRFKAPVVPGDTILLKIWKLSDGKSVFQMQNEKTGKVVIDNGEFDWE